MNIELSAKLEEIIAEMQQQAKMRALRYPNEPRETDAILQIALRHPEYGARQILQQYEQEWRERPRVHVVRLLSKNRLARPDGRDECIRDFQSSRQALHSLFTESADQEGEQAYRRLHELLNQRPKQNTPVVARLLLQDLAAEWSGCKNHTECQRLAQQLGNLLQQIRLPMSLQLLRQLVYAAAEHRGYQSRPSIRENMETIIREVEVLARGEAESGADRESLEEENADLRATLFGLRHELKALQAQINELQQNARTEAIVTLLADMNSSHNGYLLDNIIRSGRFVSQLLASGWQPKPAELESVAYLLTMLANYLEGLGVQRIRNVGDREKISISDLAFMDYTGSEFRDPADTKWVEFRTSGWRYMDRVISRPQAFEVSQSDIANPE